jgi:predicted esterase
VREQYNGELDVQRCRNWMLHLVTACCWLSLYACELPEPSERAGQPEAADVNSAPSPAAEVAPFAANGFPSSADTVDTGSDSLLEAAFGHAPAPVPGTLTARRFTGRPAGSRIENYLLYVPPAVEKQEQWPVLLYLHGRSLRGDSLELVKQYGIPWLLERGQQLPFIVVVPQLPAGERWVDTDRVAALLEDAIRGLPVDRGRIHVTGYSMGAGGAWRMAIAHPVLFASVVPIAATTPEPTREALAALAHVPALVFHGTADPAASFADAAAMVRALQARGAPAQLVVLEGADHNIVNRVYQDPSLYRWLLSQRRVSKPNESER